MRLEDHPTIRRLSQKAPQNALHGAQDAGMLRQLPLGHGADDAGLVEIDRPALEPQRQEILKNYPWTRSLLSFVVRMAREPVRGAPRSVANLEFHHTGHKVDGIASAVVRELETRGIRAANPSMGFPMEMYQTGAGAIWVVSHKPVAVQAGLGHMGIHRNLIHPKFGNFVILGTILMECEATEYDRPIDYNPCLECKLCVTACPVGAIGPEGAFNFASCFTHNYREFLGGFTDWVEQIADAKDALDYRRRVSDAETASMWQSLSHGANYKSAYCMAVCPAGEDVVGPYLENRQRHLAEVVKPLQERAEPVYVVPGSDAETIARRKFKNKTVKPVANGLRPRTIAGLLSFLPHVFQPNQSRGLNATFHFSFTGVEAREATVTIRNGSIQVQEGRTGKPDVQVTADGPTWLAFLAKETSLVAALLKRKIRLKGNPRLLLAFGKCFPTGGPPRGYVAVIPSASQLRAEPPRYQRNDPVTGKIRWVGKLRLAEVESVAPDVKTFRFRPPSGVEIPFDYLPGQFLTLHVEPQGIPIRRAYTIASTPTWRDRIEITVKREPYGLISRWLHDELKVGDEVEIEAPSGAFVFDGGQSERVLLIGAGVGITPMMSIARYLTDRAWKGAAWLVLGFRSPKDYIFREELERLAARNPNLRVTATMSQASPDEWAGARGRIDVNLLRPVVHEIGACRAHICGPPEMMETVKECLLELGLTGSQIYTEAFGTVVRNPSAKARSTEMAGKVVFQTSNLTVPIQAGQTILEVADEAGVFIDNACRSGTCASCRVKLLEGNASMEVEDALTGHDKSEGYILACQAKVRGDATVEA